MSLCGKYKILEIMTGKKQIITDFDRIIGNNQQVTDDTHMDLVDECSDYTETLVNKLFIANVSNSLNGFRKWQKENWKDVYLMSDEFMIKTYLDTL